LDSVQGGFSGEFTPWVWGAMCPAASTLRFTHMPKSIVCELIRFVALWTGEG